MNAWLTIGLLLIANVFMTFAWYGHLKLQQMKLIGENTPVMVITIVSWGLAFI